MNWELILQPLLAGLSVGAFCLTYCFPFMGAFLVAEERPFKKNLVVVLQFLLGRLIGYLIFGLVFGYLGEKMDYGWLKLATNLSFMILSVFLAFYLLGLVRETGIFCYGAPFLKKQGPLAMGFFMGINLCPPFLLSVTYVFSRHSALYGMAYFALFFLASSIYFLPLVFAGMASRTKEFRVMARVSGFLVAALFFIYGIYSIVHNGH